MFDFSTFSHGIIGIVTALVNMYMWVVIIRVLISWITPDPYTPIVQFLRAVTDPAIEAVRRFVPNFLWSTGLDFTPLILIVLLQVLMEFLKAIRI